MPGLEPGNPEGADLQSAAVAAVPHPHSVFKHLRGLCPASEGEYTPLGKTCQRNPPIRAYPYHQTYTAGRVRRPPHLPAFCHLDPHGLLDAEILAP